MAIDVKAAAESAARMRTVKAREHWIEDLVTRVVAEAVKPYEEAVSAHNAKMDKVPKMESSPKNPEDGLRFLATWFDAMYPDDADTTVQDDLRRWADEWDSAVAEAKREQMEMERTNLLAEIERLRGELKTKGESNAL